MRHSPHTAGPTYRAAGSRLTRSSRHKSPSYYIPSFVKLQAGDGVFFGNSPSGRPAKNGKKSPDRAVRSLPRSAHVRLLRSHSPPAAQKMAPVKREGSSLRIRGRVPASLAFKMIQAQRDGQLPQCIGNSNIQVGSILPFFMTARSEFVSNFTAALNKRTRSRMQSPSPGRVARGDFPT